MINIAFLGLIMLPNLPVIDKIIKDSDILALIFSQVSEGTVLGLSLISLNLIFLSKEGLKSRAGLIDSPVKPIECDIESKDWNFKVTNYKGLTDLRVFLPFNSPWIFLTGNNGYGKTNILQALARALSSRSDEIVYNANSPLEDTAKITVKIDKQIRELSSLTTIDFNKSTYRVMAYGASRLDMGSDRNSKEYKPCSSLFESQVLLRNIEREGLSRWYFKDGDKFKFEECVDIFKQLIPSLENIIVDEDSEVWYIEKDEEGDLLKEVKFNNLATGYQNIISMVGDIILNLSAPRKKSEDIKLKNEMKAIVIIDELELYLHPNWQKRLPGILTKIFPNVLFIASTHSPIPLLGAPEGSAIYSVNRNAKSGVTMTRLDEKIHIDELLPNTILTSPIFGMEDIFSSTFTGKKPVRTESDYQELDLNKKLDQKISDFFDDKTEQELIQRFNSKLEK
tara:strand:+ start:7538 stop:8893 length:1356 start_codon:yes stop_codon:yes gene_type:complete